MRYYKILMMVLAVATGVLFMAGDGLTLIPEPDNVIYGVASDNAQVITLKVNDQEIASYTMGSNPNIANLYILRIPLDDGQVQPQLPDTALPGDLAELYVNDDPAPAKSLIIGARGVLQKIDLIDDLFEDCTDGVDNDGDLDIDCEDLDCEGLICNDGLYCNGVDTCSLGTCSLPAGSPCLPSEICNEDTDSCEIPVDTDSDGVPDGEECGPNGDDCGYDGNSDGTADSLQGTAASLHTHNRLHYLTIATSAGTQLSNVRAIPNPSPGDTPDGVEFPLGFFEFTIQGIEPGSATTAALFLPEEIGVNTYWNYGSTPDIGESHWYEFINNAETYAEIMVDEVVMHFVDAQLGDDILTEDGMISTRGGPGIMPDRDGDDVLDHMDNCPDDSNPDQSDTDNDTTGNVCDNCPNDTNLEQTDTDGDCIGDACDGEPSSYDSSVPDADSDGVGDACDNCNGAENTNQADGDEDSVGDACDNCAETANPLQEDTNPPGGNNCGDACECEGDFNHDLDVDGDDAYTFKLDFGRNEYARPCTNEDPCKGDFDCDGDTDGNNAYQFKLDFGRNAYVNPCPDCVTEPWCVYTE